MTDLPLGGWIRIVGNEFRSEFLDLEYLRKKSEKVQPALRRPAVRKLTTPDGRQYKLLYVPPGNARLREMLSIIRPIKDESFVPKLLWSDNHNLLFEFIEGEFPDIHSAQFSRDIAAVLARMHEHTLPGISRLRYRLEFAYNLKTLARHDLLEPAYVRKARAMYAATVPPKILRSLDYFDIARNNFVYDRNGCLKLIDAGAFRNNRMMGQFFIGNSHFGELQTDVFWEAYKAASQNHFVYDNYRFIKLFHYVMKAGQRARSFAEASDKTTIEAKRHWQKCIHIKERLTEFLDANA